MKYESYFDTMSININKRFFFLTGNTQDLFCDDSLRLLDIQWLLYKELKDNGYELIVFYDNELKLYCFDEESFKLLRKIEETGEPVLKPSSSRRDKMKKGPLKGRLLTQRTQENVRNNISTSSNTSSECALHLDGLFDFAAIKRITGLMRDSEVKTVVIFVNALEFLRKFSGNDFDLDTFEKYRNLTNKNIVIFIVLGYSFVELNDGILSRYPEWEELFGGKHVIPGKNLIDIDLPNASEIRNLLNRFRMKDHSFMIDLKDMEKICIKLEQKMHFNQSQPDEKSAYPLKDFKTNLERYFSVHSGSGYKITLDNCVSILDIEKRKTSHEEKRQEKITVSEYSIDGLPSSRLAKLTLEEKEFDRGRKIIPDN